MKKTIFGLLLTTAALLGAQGAQAQSLKDLFNKDNISNLINTVTGNNAKVELNGTWNYTGPAISFETDDMLMKAGGAAASTVLEGKLDEQLMKIGFNHEKVNFTFNNDSTFTTNIGTHPLKGSYSYDPSSKQISLKYLGLVNLKADLVYSGESAELLFKSDKILQFITLLSNTLDNNVLNTIGGLANEYDGMMLGFRLKKQ